MIKVQKLVVFEWLEMKTMVKIIYKSYTFLSTIVEFATADIV